MAKDDYFVLVYRILNYLYEYFKVGEKPDLDMIGPAALGIPRGYWMNIMESLSNEGYIRGISFPSAIGTMGGVRVSNLKITQKGIEFLQDNSKIAQAKAFLKSIKETVPGL